MRPAPSTPPLVLLADPLGCVPVAGVGRLLVAAVVHDHYRPSRGSRQSARGVRTSALKRLLGEIDASRQVFDQCPLALCSHEGRRIAVLPFWSDRCPIPRQNLSPVKVTRLWGCP